MNRITLLIFFALGTLLVQAQKIKIKKGNIFLNKTEKIGTVKYEFNDKLNTGVETIKDLKGNAISIYMVRGDSGSSTDYFYILSANFNDKKWELSPSDIYGLRKGTIKYLLNKGFWNPKSGMDTDAISREMVSVGTAVSDAKKQKNNNEDRVKAINPFVRRSGEIIKGGPEGTEVIGYVESPNHYLETITTPILIYDIDKNLIAKGKSGIIKDERFTTFDDVEHRYRIKAELNEITKPLFLSEVVYSLMLEGYIYEGKIPYDTSINVFK